MISLTIKAVVITDGTGYVIHGASDESPEKMFAALAPIWPLDPSKETVHYIEMEVNLPELEGKDAEPL